jgi:hypothetical protein
MANKKISELQSRTPSLTDLLLVGDPSSGYSYKCTVSALATIIETDIADGYVTIGTTQTISGAKTFSNNLALTSVSNANTDTDKFLVLNASNVVNFRTGAEVLSDIGGQGALTLTTTGTSGAATLVSNVLNIPQYQGVISLASIGSSPNANGATLSSNTLTLQPASGSFGGVVTTGFQEFAGQKRFIGNPIQFDKHLEVKNIDSWGVSWGYTSLASKDTPVFGFLRGHSFAGTVTYYAWFTYGSTGERNYTLPSTDGTLALTSDITSSISGTTNYIPKFTGTSAIGNSVIYESSSNIGIGTTSPDSKLHVIDGSGNSLRVGFLAGSSNFNLYDAAIHAFRNNGGSTDYMRLTSTGLGIGTSSPAYKLDVVRTGAGILNTLSLDNLNQSVGVVDGVRLTMRGFNIEASSTYGTADNLLTIGFGSNKDIRLSQSGNLGLGVTPSAWISSWKAMQVNYGALTSRNDGLGTILGNNWYINTSGVDTYIGSDYASIYYQTNGQHRWYTAPSGTAGNTISFTQAMTLDASGRLGIGTTSPLAKLNVQSDNNDSNSGQFVVSGATSSLQRLSIGFNTTSSYGFIQPYTALSGYNNLVLVPNGGNVGIGTTSPTSISNYIALTINGTSGSFTEYQENGGRAFRIGSDGATGGFISQTTADPIRIFTNASERMRITSGGLLLIGTSSTSGVDLVRINKDGTNEYSTLNVTNANSTAVAYFGVGGSNVANSNLRNNAYIWNTGNSSSLLFGTNDTERIRITSSGEVLIGTTSTTAKLTVRDDGNTFSTHISGNSQTNGIAIGTLSTNNAAIQGYTRTFSATNNIVLQPDGGEVYIAGITDQGAYNLQVNGTGVWGAGAYVNGSDRSLKENIYDLDGCLELVKQLKPVTYKYKESYSKDTSTQTGFIAQDLKELFKDKSYLNGLVKEGGQHLSVAYQNLIPVLAKAIQELEAEIEILKNK